MSIDKNSGCPTSHAKSKRFEYVICEKQDSVLEQLLTVEVRAALALKTAKALHIFV